MEKYHDISNMAIVDHSGKAQEEFVPSKMDSVRSPSLPTEKSDWKKTNPEAYSSFKSPEESRIRRYENRYRDGKSRSDRNRRHLCLPSHEACEQTNSAFDLELFIFVNGRYCTATSYRLYRLIDRSQGCDNDAASKMQRMRKKITVQM